ncbi:sigma-70 family RNA polymerase sigma factor [Actinosynnema sp. NPDC091369]
MRTTADSALVRAAATGDLRARDELVAWCLPLVRNVVRRALPDDPEADDVVQETMLRVVRGLPGLRDPERFRAWLVTTAIRQVRDHARERRAWSVRKLPLDVLDDAADPTPSAAEDAVDRVEFERERRDLLAATRWLTPDEQRVLTLWWQEVNGELTRAEVAQALELSPQHTAVRVQRMRERLLLARTVLRAWRAAPRCPGLTEAGRGWSGTAESKWFKRLARHVRGCPVCGAVGAPRVPSDHLAVAIGVLAAPPAVQALPAAGSFTEFAHWVLGHLSVKTAAVGAPALAAAVAVTVWTTSPPDEPPAAVAIPSIPAATSTAAPASAAPVASSAPAIPSAYYVSPTGDDTAEGSEQAPFATLGRAVAAVQPGQTIYLRGGTHRATASVDITTSGTPDRRITLTSFPGEHAVLDAAGAPADRPFIAHGAAHWTVRGLEITGAPSTAYSCRSCRGTVFQQLSVHDNLGTGLHLSGPGTADNQVLDSDFHRNADTAGREADGLAIGPGDGTGNVVRGTRTFHNLDDGLVVQDFVDPVAVDSAWSYGNGVDRWSSSRPTGSGHGFDLGRVGAHVVTRSAAWKNKGHGFTTGGVTGKQFTANSAFRNAEDGFALGDTSSVVRRNFSFGNKAQVVPTRRNPDEGNTWDLPGWGTDVLRELDPATAEGPRQPDGSLPVTAFLTNTKDASVGAPMTAGR